MPSTRRELSKAQGTRNGQATARHDRLTTRGLDLPFLHLNGHCCPIVRNTCLPDLDLGFETSHVSFQGTTSHTQLSGESTTGNCDITSLLWHNQNRKARETRDNVPRTWPQRRRSSAQADLIRMLRYSLITDLLTMSWKMALRGETHPRRVHFFPHLAVNRKTFQVVQKIISLIGQCLYLYQRHPMHFVV